MEEKNGLWHWYHNISECYYHLQITVKYRKSLLDKRTEQIILETLKEFQERYEIEIQEVGFDQNHVHILCRFLPKYSGGQIIRVIKSRTAQNIFKEIPEMKKKLWGREFWTDGYYIATISGRGNKKVIEEYIRKQGREETIKQMKLFEI